MMRILVVGAGATGGYFGGRLALAGRDVTFLVRPGRAAQLARRGLVLRTPEGEERVPAPRLVGRDAVGGPFDLVLLAVKAYALEGALADMAPAVGPETMVLPLLNGVRHMDELAARFGTRVLGGVCRIAADLDPAGDVVRMGPVQDLLYGEMDASRPARILAVDAQMQGAGFRARLAEDIVAELWHKWLMLASLGAVTCLMRGTVGQVMAAPHGEALVRRLVAEVAATMERAGHAPAPRALETCLRTLTERGSGFASSMYRDLHRGAPVEADEILGDLLARAEAAGLDTPLLLAAAAHLETYQAARGGRA